LSPKATLPRPLPSREGRAKYLSPGERGKGEGDLHRNSLSAGINAACYRGLRSVDPEKFFVTVPERANAGKTVVSLMKR